MWRTIGLVGLLIASAAGATDEPVVLVAHERITPARLEVHVGEIVTWRAGNAQVLRLELDPHPSAHEVVMRSGEIRAFFRKPGTHWYSVAVQSDGHRTMRGVVMVRQESEPRPGTPFCSRESSEVICVEP
jgi:hypothetical protein